MYHLFVQWACVIKPYYVSKAVTYVIKGPVFFVTDSATDEGTQIFSVAIRGHEGSPWSIIGVMSAIDLSLSPVK